jgi:thymidylate synthase (FAD)
MDLAANLRDMRESGAEGLAASSKRDARKRVQQLARMVLSHEVEAPMVMTGNVRSWRHFIEMRANEHADVEIRILAYGIYTLLLRFDPVLFDDYDVVELEDGTKALRTEFRKV